MQYQNAEIDGVYNTDQGFTVVLEVEEVREILPIFISKTQALSIKAGLDSTPISRPLTHDLLLKIIEDLNLEMESVTIDDLMEGTFLAELRLNRGDRIFPYDVRPSDGIAMAGRNNAEILVAKKVIEKAGVRRGEIADSGYEI